MSEVIALPDRGVVLIPLAKCVGANFNGYRFKQVTYRYEDYIIVEYCLAVCQELARIGVEVGSPILTDYRWPSKYPCPMDHQVVTADFLVRNKRSFCFNEIGTAKTLSALWAADYLMRAGQVKKVLVASTLSTLWRVWEDEIFCNIMPRKSVVLHGSMEKRLKLLKQDVEYYIINHDGLKLLRNELMAFPFDLVIIDEGAEFKNSNTDLWRAANAVCGAKSGRMLWWLTGSPMPKAPTDAWAQARIVNPDTVPPYFSRFRNQTMYKATTFKWVPLSGWEKIVYASLRPAVRFERKQCMDLPPAMYIDHEVKMSSAQAKAYTSLETSLVAELEAGMITAANEGVKLSKLLQLSCLTGDTDVLTDSGWRQLIALKPDDLLWDGVKWVNYSGILDNGYMDTVDCWGVQMTLDHKLLTDKGWREAWEIANGESSNRFNRSDFQLPDGYKTGRLEKDRSENKCKDGPENKCSSFMGVPLHLRRNSDQVESEHTQKRPHTQKLWLHARRRDKNSRSHKLTSFVQSLVQNKVEMQLPFGQGLQKLWCERYKNVCQMGQFFTVLGRYGEHIQAGFNLRTRQQLEGVLSWKLPLGDVSGARKQHTPERTYSNSERRNDCSASRERVQDKVWDYTSKTAGKLDQRWQGHIVKNRVYDLLNVGDNSRFLIRNKKGEMFLSHNCGAVYDSEGKRHFLDVSPKFKELKQIIEEAGEKLIIFVPFKHTIQVVKEWLDKHEKDLTYGIVTGDVGITRRNKIYKEFQSGDLNILLAHPKCMAHGLTFTATNTILWWTPYDDFKIYEQANGRVSRPGQERKQYIKHLICSPVEKVVYKRLKNKESMQGILLDMIKK